MASRLRAATGLPRWVVTGDRLLEGEETEEKFFWDLVREPLSSNTSSFTVAFRMLLKEASARKIVNKYQLDKMHQIMSGSLRTYLNDGFWLELLGVSGFSE